jgi:CheY-like chemotaxis protein
VVSATDLDAVEDALMRLPAHALVITDSEPEQLWHKVESARTRLTDTPIIGYATPVAFGQQLMKGAFDYLIKPVTRADLRKAIQQTGELRGCAVRNILIVDDDDDFRLLLSRMLHALDARLCISTARDGSEAMAHLDTTIPDLILLDVSMPNMDGWELLARKEASATLRPIPAVIISAQDPAALIPHSRILLATIGEGIPTNKLLRCTLALSDLLLKPDT